MQSFFCRRHILVDLLWACQMLSVRHRKRRNIFREKLFITIHFVQKWDRERWSVRVYVKERVKVNMCAIVRVRVREWLKKQRERVNEWMCVDLREREREREERGREGERERGEMRKDEWRGDELSTELKGLC